jgi:ethanolamine utilization protein EutN
MQLALVQGTATATVKHPSLRRQRLLVAQRLDAKGEAAGDPQLILDQLGARAGDTVIISSDGRGLRELLDDTTSPARWYTLGIVDSASGNAAIDVQDGKSGKGAARS